MARLGLGLILAALVMGCEGSVGEGDGVVDDSDAPMVGWAGVFDGRAHDVAGSVELVDAQTLRISNFTYDGGGVDARFFLVVDGAPFDDQFELSDNQVGTPRDSETFDLVIPEGATEGTWDTLSLWCVPFGANFGHAVLAPDG